jgi:hypothetical protein
MSAQAIHCPDALLEHLRMQRHELRAHRYWDDFVAHAGDVLCGYHPTVDPAGPVSALVADFQRKWHGITSQDVELRVQHDRMFEDLHEVFGSLPVPTASVTASFAWRFGVGALLGESCFRRQLAQLIEQALFAPAPTP